MSINRTNEEKLDLLADLVEPAAAIIEDKEWLRKWKQGNRAAAIRDAIANHKKELVEIFALIEGQDPATYRIDGVALFVKIITMFDRPDLEVVNGLFTSQGQSDAVGSSGSATGNTGDGAQ